MAVTYSDNLFVLTNPEVDFVVTITSKLVTISSSDPNRDPQPYTCILQVSTDNGATWGPETVTDMVTFVKMTTGLPEGVICKLRLSNTNSVM